MRFLFLGLLVCFLSASAIAEPELNTYLGTDSTLQVSYNIKGEDANNFFEQLTDTLKAGKKISIVHKVTLKEAGIWGATLVETKYSFPLDYDVLQSLYIYDKGGVQASSNIMSVKKSILSLNNLKLILKSKLTKDKSYRILIEIYSENIIKKKQKTGWKNWVNKITDIPLPSFTRNKLNYEVPYIAR